MVAALSAGGSTLTVKCEMSTDGKTCTLTFAYTRAAAAWKFNDRWPASA
jgi:hypothetical protein